MPRVGQLIGVDAQLNLGVDDYCEVNDSIGWICDALGVSPKLEYSGGDRGWIGDSPFVFLDTARIQALGWKPKCTIREGVLSAGALAPWFRDGSMPRLDRPRSDWP